MKKLYRKSTVHPTPSVVSEHLLSFLPAAILALTAALSPADREVLAYLISCSSASFSNKPPQGEPEIRRLRRLKGRRRPPRRASAATASGAT
ncbi:hypothetical protein PHJA_002976000 [Phtheirospermum japonicum]|uniref:Uncharacterized protein n=1 Tax=Phtheirospermum japonicum TaxID=374723 RepID=A0A830DAW4_9LAMI|nr:hypothetical protein PHJA_002976000 [Phtheirospermum japonicum]